MKTTNCGNCGAKAQIVRGDFLWHDVDVPITLTNVEQIHCEACGNHDAVIPRLAHLMRTIALALIWKPFRLRGEEVRFLRKYLNMTGAEFSALLRVDTTALSKWENNDDPVVDQSDMLIRMITAGLGGSGLRTDIEGMIRGFPEIGTDPKKIGIRIDPETMSYEFDG